MRRAIAAVVVAGTIVAVIPTVASGVSARCGTTYTTPCTVPKVHYKLPPAACTAAGRYYNLPRITVTSNSGIRVILVRYGNHTILRKTFTGLGPTQYILKGLRLRTRHIKAGAHRISIKVTDVRGKSTSRTLRFAVCKSTPVFTG